MTLFVTLLPTVSYLVSKRGKMEQKYTQRDRKKKAEKIYG